MQTQTKTAGRQAPVGAPRMQSAMLDACAGRPAKHTPIWLMRQAGRYMAEYRALRAKHAMLDLIRTPELAAEVTLQPIKRFELDAAIIFADILPPLIGMGLELDFVEGVGPQIANPLTTTRDIDMLATPPATETLAGTLAAVKIVSAELESKQIPLIGFAGAPFTLASYAIEGGGSKQYAKTKSLMFSEPAAWKRLMEKLVTVQADYLLQQAKAGASVLQIFDSWVGQALGLEAYERFVLPYNRSLFERLHKQIAANCAAQGVGVPVVNFSTGTGAYIDRVAAAGGDVVGVDWRMPLDWYWSSIGDERPIQGNLDPIALLSPWRELQFQVDAILNQAGGRPGHIFNLGHGILPQTPVDTVARLVDYVHEKTAK